jgi:glucose-1-phosphate adenylyltransferase
MSNAFGIIFANIHDEALPQLTRNRTLGAVPLGGRYRLIDFILSDMVNSGITPVGVIARNNYHSLVNHLGSGKEWDLSRKFGGLTIFPPYSTDGTGLYQGRLEAMKSVMSYIVRAREEYAVLADSNIILNIDLSKVLEYHEENDADVTCVYQNVELKEKNAKDRVLYEMDGNRVTAVFADPRISVGNVNNSLGIWVMKKDLLVRIIDDAQTSGKQSLERDVLAKHCKDWKIIGYGFGGFVEQIRSVSGYYRAGMALLDADVRAELFPRQRPIYTKVHDESPVYYTPDAVAQNSLIANGCRIEGTVENSILGRGVYVAKGAVVRNSLLMQGVTVSEGSTVDCAIVDKNSYISPNRTLSGAPTYPFVAEKGSRI